jgi:5-methylcytosine-specific restriction endonuclease McrA
MEETSLTFEYPEDERAFNERLSDCGGIENNRDLFDFRDPLKKRKEFNQIRNQVFEELKVRFGSSCLLKCHPDCTNIGTEVDHLIPLSSNVLNKEIRNIKGENRKKVPTQSFGSNHRSNFILACSRCNAFKKHRLPDTSLLARALKPHSPLD